MCREDLAVFLISAPVPSQGSTLITQHTPNFFPKATLPNTIMLGLKLQHMNLGGIQAFSPQHHTIHPSRVYNWRRKWQPIPVFLPWKSHGWRSLVGYSPWGPKRVRHALVTKQQQSTQLNEFSNLHWYTQPSVQSTGTLCLSQKETQGLPWWYSSKESPADAGDTGSIPGLRRFHMPWGQLSSDTTTTEPTFSSPSAAAAEAHAP